MTALAPGDKVGRYVVEAMIGEGGMGRVYRARDPQLERPVALKVLAVESATGDGTARLLREARAAAALHHENAVAVFDVGESDGVAYIAMELVSGSSLRTFVGDASVSLRTKLRWLRDVARVLDEVKAQGRVPILVGGTGLYFKALSAGLAAVPPIPADIRAQVRGRLQSEGAPALHAELARLDPATAQRITCNDRSRIARALEVALATGRPLSDWHRDGLPPLLDAGRAAKVFVTCERRELVARIEARFAAMLKAGALDEVRALAARKLDPLLPAMKAHGVPWLVRHLAGEITLDEAAAGAIMDTRRYAKRQLTWFRNQMPNWPWVEAAVAALALEKQLQPD